MVELIDKKNQSKSNFCKCLIAKSQQLNQLYNSNPFDFSLIFNVGINAIICSASVIFSYSTSIITTEAKYIDLSVFRKLT